MLLAKISNDLFKVIICESYDGKEEHHIRSLTLNRLLKNRHGINGRYRIQNKYERKQRR